MSNVTNIYPSNSFSHVSKASSKEIEVGIIIGYDKEGNLTIYGGGMLNNKQPTASDWLWMIETFKSKLIAGDYSEDV